MLLSPLFRSYSVSQAAPSSLGTDSAAQHPDQCYHQPSDPWQRSSRNSTNHPWHWFLRQWHLETLARLLERRQRDGAVPCHLSRCAWFGAEGHKDVLDSLRGVWLSGRSERVRQHNLKRGTNRLRLRHTHKRAHVQVPYNHYYNVNYIMRNWNSVLALYCCPKKKTLPPKYLHIQYSNLAAVLADSIHVRVHNILFKVAEKFKSKCLRDLFPRTMS